MSNVISFDKFFQEKKQVVDNLAKEEQLTKENYDSIVNIYNRFLKLEDLAELFPVTHLVYTVLFKATTRENFLNSLEIFVPMISPSALSNQNCAMLTNSYSTPEIPQNNLKVFMLGNLIGFSEVAQINTEEFLKGTSVINVAKDEDAKLVYFDYLNEHPDVDDPIRGVGGVLTLFGYVAIEELYERNYSLTRFVYHVDYDNERKCKKPGAILMEFANQMNGDAEKTMYLYFDFEAMMKSIDVYYEGWCGRTLQERRDLINTSKIK